jgi:1,4-dihydroxy-6-naphthoate synthase
MIYFGAGLLVAPFSIFNNMDTSVRSLTLAHSPDSDDAFMFWALKEGLVGTNGFNFEHILSDIQTLNQAALEGRYDVTAVSLHCYPYIANQYVLMNTGASIGDGYGPIVVSRKQMSLDDLSRKQVAIPGSLTTAALMLKLAIPGIRTEEMKFDTIMDAVKRGYVDAGLIIHEGQISYKEMGLHLVVDFGDWWKKETGLPLPLGVNVIKRDLGEETIKSAVGSIRESVKYGLEHRAEAISFAQDYGRDLEQPDVDRFVAMYVNDYTVDLGDKGRNAIRELLNRSSEAGITPAVDDVQFVG